MNKFWETLAWIALTSFVVYACWPVNSNESFLQIHVLKTDLDKATKGCNNGVIQVALFDSKGRHMSIPCYYILNQPK